MLLREEDDGTVLAIAQVAHSAVAGRLASVWRARPPALAGTWSELCLGAAIHDLAWGDWDQRPRLDPDTGRPYAFRSLPDDDWVEVWSQASRRAAPYGRVVELWVLRHAARLMRSERTEAMGRVRREVQDRLAWLEAQVAADPALRLDRRAVEDGTALLATWDALSLALCHGIDAPLELDGRTLSPVGPSSGELGGAAAPSARGVVRIALDPWPLEVDGLELRADGRVLAGPVGDQAELEAQWAAAEVRSLVVELVPG